MEVRVIISSLSLGLGDTGFGLNVVSGAYIQTRVSIGAPVTIYGIVDKLSMGSDSELSPQNSVA